MGGNGLPAGFYVYELIDPRIERVFYIGKGQGRRAWQHEAAVRRGDCSQNARKCAVISDIINAGLSVAVRIVADYDSEEDALDHEFRLVDADPTLTNIAPGGLGRVASPEEIARRRHILSKRLAEQRKVAKAAARARDLERKRVRDEETARGFSALTERDSVKEEIEDWAAEIPNGISAGVRLLTNEAERTALRARQSQNVRKRRQAKQSGYYTDEKYPGMFFPSDDHVLRRLFNR